MQAIGIFPSAPQLMTAPLFALASAYRAVFAVAGGYTTARLSPDRPMRHAWILAGIGLVAGIAGVIAYYMIGGERSARPGTRSRFRLRHTLRLAGCSTGSQSAATAENDMKWAGTGRSAIVASSADSCHSADDL